jgi:hypothetical protein
MAPCRGSILSQGAELFKGQRRHQVGIIDTEDDRALLTRGDKPVQRGCGEIELQSLIEHLQQSPKSQISRRDIHRFVLSLLGKRQVHVQE